MERLTKRGSDGKAYAAKTPQAPYIAEVYEELAMLERERLERLCEFEDKIESGQLVEHLIKKSIMEEEKVGYDNPVGDMYESGHNSCMLCGKAKSTYLGCQDCGAVFCEDCETEAGKCPACGGEHLV